MAANNPTYDIYINQNATFAMSMQLTDATGSAIDITGWSFTGSLKESYESAEPYLYFTSSVSDFSSSIINIELSADQTELLTETRYVYDVVGSVNNPTAPDYVYRLLQGKVVVSPGVTTTVDD